MPTYREKNILTGEDKKPMAVVIDTISLTGRNYMSASW